MTKKTLFAALIVGAALIVAGPARAAGKTVVKLATLAPDGSVWHQTLKKMAADEPDMVRKMRIGQLQAASLSVTGLSKIDKGFMVFSIPLFFDSYDELFYVMRRLEPTLRGRLESNGFVMLNWGLGGWVHFFSESAVTSVDGFRDVKMFVWAGDDKWVQWWKDNGFHPVPLAATDILTGLQTGMINGLPTTPLAALSLQWFRHAPYMLDLGLAPLVGATVITEKAWRSIPEDERGALLSSAKEVETTLEREVPAQDEQAITEMAKRGLTVTHAGDDPRWSREAARLAAKMREGMVPQDIFDLAVAARDEYRAQHKKDAGSSGGSR